MTLYVVHSVLDKSKKPVQKNTDNWLIEKDFISSCSLGR